MAKFPSVLVPVDLVPCVVSVIAEPGDRLMILNGVCVGVDTSSSQPPAALPAPSADPAVLTTPRKRKRATQAKPPSRIHRSLAQIENDINRISEFLTNRGPSQLRFIIKHLDSTKSHVRNALTIMQRRGLLATPSQRGSGYYIAYSLATTTAPHPTQLRKAS